MVILLLCSHNWPEVLLSTRDTEKRNGISYLCLSHGIECSECRPPGIRFLPYETDLDSDKDVNSAQIEEHKQKNIVGGIYDDSIDHRSIGTSGI